ncbi:hypothetical protein CRYUN_Cryun19dG0068900 [Craigia yunnanensis]
MDNLSEEESESRSKSEEEDVRLAETSKNSIYNRDGLIEKLQDISWPKYAEWMHKLSLDINQEKEVDVNDDLARELDFYTQALEGTRLAFEKFQSMGLPFLRAPDYYAEMKKQKIEVVKKWRKQRQQSGFPAGGKDELDLGFEDGKAFERSSKKRPKVSPGDRSGGKAKQGGGKAPTYDKQDLEVKQLLNRSEQATNASRVSSAYETATEHNRGNRNGCNANNTNDADEDDELRRRVEEFIAKVNEWRAEKLGMFISA